jgi:hypothetical protein
VSFLVELHNLTIRLDPDATQPQFKSWVTECRRNRARISHNNCSAQETRRIAEEKDDIDEELDQGDNEDDGGEEEEDEDPQQISLAGQLRIIVVGQTSLETEQVGDNHLLIQAMDERREQEALVASESNGWLYHRLAKLAVDHESLEDQLRPMVSRIIHDAAVQGQTSSDVEEIARAALRVAYDADYLLEIAATATAQSDADPANERLRAQANNFNHLKKNRQTRINKGMMLYRRLYNEERATYLQTLENRHRVSQQEARQAQLTASMEIIPAVPLLGAPLVTTAERGLTPTQVRHSSQNATLQDVRHSIGNAAAETVRHSAENAAAETQEEAARTEGLIRAIREGLTPYRLPASAATASKKRKYRVHLADSRYTGESVSLAETLAMQRARQKKEDERRARAKTLRQARAAEARGDTATVDTAPQAPGRRAAPKPPTPQAPTLELVDLTGVDPQTISTSSLASGMASAPPLDEASGARLVSPLTQVTETHKEGWSHIFFVNGERFITCTQRFPEDEVVQVPPTTQTAVPPTVAVPADEEAAGASDDGHEESPLPEGDGGDVSAPGTGKRGRPAEEDEEEGDEPRPKRTST